MQPSEFWGMTPTELWWLYDSKVPKDLKDKYSGDYWAEMYEVLERAGV